MDEPRPGAPRTITDEQVEQVITKTLGGDRRRCHPLVDPGDGSGHRHEPDGHRCGSGGRSGSSRTWTEAWKLSTDPQFIDKVRDIVGLYLNPPEAAVVLCVDEKSQIQALDRTAPVLPLLPGTPQRRSHDYTRHGTTNLYAALEMASGKVISQMTPRHRAMSSSSSWPASTARCRPSWTCT